MRPKTSSRLHRLVGDIDPIFMTIAAGAGVLFAILSVVVAVHPAPFFFDRPLATDVQSVTFSAINPFDAFVSSFSGFVGIGVGVAAIVATFVLRRQATPFVAFRPCMPWSTTSSMSSSDDHGRQGSRTLHTNSSVSAFPADTSPSSSGLARWRLFFWRAVFPVCFATCAGRRSRR